MNSKLELAVQDLALAVVNKNAERAARVVSRMPQDVIEKVAYGAEELFILAVRRLPAGVGQEIKRNIEAKRKGDRNGDTTE
jgi:hypothetical protein